MRWCRPKYLDMSGQNNQANLEAQVTSGKEQPEKLFEDLLKEYEVNEPANQQAAKLVLAYQLFRKIKSQGLSKSEMAWRLQTSRSQLDRLIDPANDDVTVGALSRAAKVVGCNLRIELA